MGKGWRHGERETRDRVRRKRTVQDEMENMDTGLSQQPRRRTGRDREDDTQLRSRTQGSPVWKSGADTTSL